jgi:serine/threonine protein kinase
MTKLSSTGTPTSNLVLKQFSSDELLGAFHEGSVYAALTANQGRDIPFCYGLYHVDNEDGVAFLFERIQGAHLDQYLQERPHLEMKKVHEYYFTARQALRVLHVNGFAHQDVRGANLLATADRPVVLVDFDRSR